MRYEMKPDVGKINCACCGRVNVLLGCAQCRRCEHCGCICQRCHICGGKHHPKVFCRICGKNRVHEKCECRGKPAYVNIPQLKTTQYLNHLDRHLGLEIEISTLGEVVHAMTHPPKGLTFQWVRDGSITPGGQELVVAPMKGDVFLTGVGWLGKMFKQYQCVADASCGLHVHVGALDFGPYELRRLLQVYTKVEQEIYTGIVSPSRWGNRFCRPMKDAFDGRLPKIWTINHPAELRRWFLKWLYPDLRQRDVTVCKQKPGFEQVMQMKRHKYQQCRYFGLNFHSWMQRGTIEWRQCQGTTDVERLLFWPLFCGWFTEIVGGLQDGEAREIKCLQDLLDGVWKKPFKTLEFPKVVKDWVKSQKGAA